MTSPLAGILPNGKNQFIDVNGKPLVGGQVYFYVPGTTTPKTTWQDPLQAIPTTNPIILDSRGQALIYGSGQYRQVVKDSANNTIWDQLTEWDAAIPPPQITSALVFRMDGGGSVIATGIAGDLYCPFACTITAWTLQADQSGNLVVDIWEDGFVANTPPTVADTITASALPTLSSNQQLHSAALTGWTTAIAAGSAFRFNVNSATTITRFTLTLTVLR